jgi:hypothetical protein
LDVGAEIQLGKDEVMREVSRLVFCLSAILGLFGCRGHLEADPPKREEVPPQPQIESSVLSVLIELPLAAVRTQLEQNIRRVIAEKEWESEPTHLRYRVTRQDLEISIDGSDLFVTVPVTLDIEAKGRRERPRRRRPPAVASCQAKLLLRFKSTLEVARDWSLKSTTRLLERTWLQPCEITRFRLDITEQLDMRFEPRLEEMTERIDERIATSQVVGNRVAEIWGALHRPIQSKSGYWLALRPQELGIGSLSGKDQTVTTSLRLLARPQLLVSDEAPEISDTPLPDNRFEESDGLFHIALDAQLPFEDATRQLNQRLVGRAFELAGQSVTIAGVRIYGNGAKAVVEVHTEGDLRSTVYLSGTPIYDQETGELWVEGLDFTLSTKNVVADTADWFLHESIIEQIGSRARFPIGDQFQEARQRLEEALNRSLTPRIDLQGKVVDLVLRSVYVTPDAFRAIVSADGELSIRVK